MALYHFTAKAISMGNGESAVHRAAYHARTQLNDERNGKATRDYAHRGDLAWSGIFAPKDAPDWARDRRQLWNRAEKAERQANGQPARNIEFALPNELTREQQIRLLTDFTREQFARKGMIADVCLHSDFDAAGVRRPGVRPDEPRNDHAHMMLTMRRLDGDMFKKTKTDAREWNSKEQLAAWREGWAKAGAKALQKAGFATEAERFAAGHLTLPEQRADALKRGDAVWADHLDREPDIKQGAAVSQMEERGQKTDRGEKRRDVEDRNAERADLTAESKVIDLELERIKRQEQPAAASRVAFNEAAAQAGQGHRQRARAEREAADKVRTGLDERFRAQRERHGAAYQGRQDEFGRLRYDHQAQRDALYGKYATALDAIWKPEPPTVVGPDRLAWDRVNQILASRKAVFDARENHVWGQLVNAVVLGRGRGVAKLIRLALDPAERRRLFEREQRIVTAKLAPRRTDRPRNQPRPAPPEPRRAQAERLKSMRAAELAGIDRTFRAAEGAVKARHQFQRAHEQGERDALKAEAKVAWSQHRAQFAPEHREDDPTSGRGETAAERNPDGASRSSASGVKKGPGEEIAASPENLPVEAVQVSEGHSASATQEATQAQELGEGGAVSRAPLDEAAQIRAERAARLAREAESRRDLDPGREIGR